MWVNNMSFNLKYRNPGSLTLLSLQVIAHLAFFILCFYGSALHWLICFFAYFLTGCLGMSMTYHRLLAHRSWRAPLWFKRLGILLGTIGLTGTALAWVAIHRQHHSSADRHPDPHSPNIIPWWHIQFLSMFYRPNLRYVKDLLQDDFIVYCHRNYLLIQLIFVVTLLLIDPFSMVYVYLAPAAILWHGGSLINTIGHKWGYTNYLLQNNSKNNLLLGIFMWGEGWHNNHHATPNQKSFQKKFWELDVSAALISILETK